jgi:hypothetical protein
MTAAPTIQETPPPPFLRRVSLHSNCHGADSSKPIIALLPSNDKQTLILLLFQQLPHGGNTPHYVLRAVDSYPTPCKLFFYKSVKLQHNFLIHIQLFHHLQIARISGVVVWRNAVNNSVWFLTYCAFWCIIISFCLYFYFLWLEPSESIVFINFPNLKSHSRGNPRWPHDTLCPQKLALTYPTSGSR